MKVSTKSKLIIDFLKYLLLILFIVSSSRVISQDMEESLKVSGIKKEFVNIIDVPVTIILKNALMRDVIIKITDETGVKMVYQDEAVDFPVGNLSFKNEPLRNILDKLLVGKDLTYIVLGNERIVLKKKEQQSTNETTVKGTVKNESGELLIGANVKIKETKIGTTTNEFGMYEFSKLTPGTYTIEVSFIGYKKESKEFRIRAGESVTVNFILAVTVFYIGGIEVVADEEFIPTKLETRTVVSSGEIEHMQASCLNDVLELTPGIETTNPTLNLVEKAIVRRGDAIGTQIILDGIPKTNNANMQVGIGYSTANSGVDLRSIPAENIQEIEIIRGIPSAQYGDFTDGIMIVKTKFTAEPFKVKLKYNPDLYETNLSGGASWGKWILNSNINLAISRRDIRVQGDGYTRIAVQLNAERESEEYNIKNIFNITRAYDEKKETPGYALREAWFNRDINVKYSLNYSRSFSAFSKFAANLSLAYTKQNSYNQQIVSRDNIVISNRLSEGAQEGYIVFGSYLGKKWIKGDVWNIYSDLNHNFRFFTGDILHNWILGVRYRNDFNKGEGIIFDPFYPPSLTIPTPRLRTYSDLPSYNILNLYIEDKFTGTLFNMPFTLQLGLNYEIFRPKEFNIEGFLGKKDVIESYNGSFLNPRVNFSYKIFESTQIRLGYGSASKSPPMGMIFAEKKYYDIVDTVSIINPAFPDSNFSIISTYIRDQANEFLKGYKQKKYEFSIDQDIGDFGFTITAFTNESKNMFQSFSQPTIFYKTSYPNWPDQSIAIKKDTLLDLYSQYSNNGWMKIKGIEFSLKTKRIPIINTILKFDAAYDYKQEGTEKGFYFSSRRYVKELGSYVMPMYNSYGRYYKNLLLNYRFEIQARSLGIWTTLHIQQKVIEIDGRQGYDDVLAIGYYSQNGELVKIPESERNNPIYSSLKRNIQLYELNEENRPNKWLINIKVSKSLWDGASVSFYVNNFLYNQPLYQNKRSSPTSPSFERRNPKIFYGLEFSTFI